jgi:anhydro-N-acetylmuramic acid kinase
MAEILKSLGFMTGTSLDGLDAAILETDGETVIVHGPGECAPFDPGLRHLLERAVAEARLWAFAGPAPAIFAEAEAALTRAHADAALRLLDKENLAPADIDVIGFHGQTVLHRAPAPGRMGATRQLGDGALLASLTGIDVVNDFRTADVAAGGHGAPLAALYHAALLQRDGCIPPCAALNLGGVANLTLVDGQGTVVAFDCGPASGPIDQFVRAHCGGMMDTGGMLAASGRADAALLARLMQNPFFAAPPPKSLDRYEFTHDLAEGLSLQDGAATLTELAAAGVARGLQWAAGPPSQLIVSGGGRHNTALMAALARRCAPTRVLTAEAAGWRGDLLEAELFAWLAVRHLRSLPLTLPSTTGAPRAMEGGMLHRAGRGAARRAI